MRYNSTRFLIMFLLLLCTEAGCVLPAQANGDRRALNREQTADRRFLRQKFDKAMALYEKAVADAESTGVQAAVHAKTARMYYMLRRYPEAVQHFSTAMTLQEEMLTVNDVCDYIDALRMQGLEKQAEEVCLRYAFQSVYSRNQRYSNTLDALSMRHGLLSDGYYEVVAERACNTTGAEYWVSNVNGQPYYARSDSRFNDPGKRFYYDSEFFPVFGSSKKRSVYTDKDIEGPFALFPGGEMIATVVEGKTDRKIGMTGGRLNPHITKLLMSGAKRQKRNADFVRLFPQQDGYSYCHPFVFDDGYALLFASDAPGGMGGYDLYMTCWDDEMRLWEDPMNLGPEINTDGDELFPACFEGKLYFSSNGQPGLGGYDLYSYEYDDEAGVFVPGTLTHLSSPVNSSYNDFCLAPMDETWGYFISDRNLSMGDDVYAYRLTERMPASMSPFFGMSETNAVTGGQALLAGRLEQTGEHKTKNVRFPAYAPKGIVLTLYFDFNRADLTAEAMNQLERFLRADRAYEIRNFRILGYADEMGSEVHNQALSCERGETVADVLRRRFKAPMKVLGCGGTPLTEVQRNTAAELMYDTTLRFDPELAHSFPVLSFADRIRANQPSRRVDVYINE